MIKEPRRHHFLSQCYLKRFTEKEKIFLLKKDKKQSCITSPLNIANKRDFNKIDSETISSSELEKELGKLETQFDKAIENVEKTNIFEGNDRIIILNFMALYAVRSPYRRASFDATMSHFGNHILSLLPRIISEGKEIDIITKEGEHKKLIVTKELKDVIDNDASKLQVKLKMPQNWHIESELKVFNEILPGFMARRWILAQAPENLYFITSDYPVVLLWKSPIGRHPPGFDCRNTQIIFPLTKKLVLVGEFDGVEGKELIIDRQVNEINTTILSSAKIYAYSPNLNFFIINRDDILISGSNLFSFFENKPSKMGV